MIKTDELRKLSDEKLEELSKELEYSLTKSYALFNKEMQGANESGMTRAITKKGTKTSTSKNLKRTIAKILTILNERRREKEKSEWQT